MGFANRYGTEVKRMMTLCQLQEELLAGDLTCGANVRKISELPKKEYLKNLESKLDN